MATQKKIVADVRDYARDLGCTCTVRKNGYGEYEARVKYNGERDYVLHYFTPDFSDAVETVKATLNGIWREQRRIGEERKAQYARDLDTAIGQAHVILALVGCTLSFDKTSGCVTMHSPKTGSHTLNMSLGVRPVSDLTAHACGFAEQQTHVMERFTLRYTPKNGARQTLYNLLRTAVDEITRVQGSLGSTDIQAEAQGKNYSQEEIDLLRGRAR